MKGSHALTALIIAWFAVLGCTHAVTLEVREGNSTCIKAEFSASFSITYNTSTSVETVQVPLPDSAEVDAGSSSCGDGGGGLLWLVAVFGPGHTLGMSFSTNGSLYSVANLTLQYNLSDASVFPGANSSGVVSVVSISVGISAKVNTTYRCLSVATFDVGGATVTFSDMRMEAYMPGDDLSSTESVCMADQASTTAPPSTTTAAPPPPPPVPTAAVQPNQGWYSVNNTNGTNCLLAQMGLQFNISVFSVSQNKTVREIVNLDPGLTNTSGTCTDSRATLVLMQERNTVLNFTFTLNSTKYHLSGISLTANWPGMTDPFSVTNNNLDFLRSSLGRSYMCNAEQMLVVSPDFSLNTFKLQVQPFGVTTSQFATAEECQMDQDQMLIPIIVGAALAGLVLIVLIAYLIGRKRSHAGYQTI
ncbi:lysosome-associated membrane glycoprotein 1a [Genypterus blacodes]|uniref:lysosome-associated membrane glycoprotein 1a n=1 Tax=Genypterus blacodes TaxID=154954 RepID=UPI003F7616C8